MTYCITISAESKAVRDLTEAELAEIEQNEQVLFESAIDLPDGTEYARLADGRTVYRESAGAAKAVTQTATNRNSVVRQVIDDWKAGYTPTTKSLMDAIESLESDRDALLEACKMALETGRHRNAAGDDMLRAAIAKAGGAA